jgi:hypothetical protein
MTPLWEKASIKNHFLFECLHDVLVVVVNEELNIVKILRKHYHVIIVGDTVF